MAGAEPEQSVGDRAQLPWKHGTDLGDGQGAIEGSKGLSQVPFHSMGPVGY